MPQDLFIGGLFSQGAKFNFLICSLGLYLDHPDILFHIIKSKIRHTLSFFLCEIFHRILYHDSSQEDGGSIPSAVFASASSFMNSHLPIGIHSFLINDKLESQLMPPFYFAFYIQN